MMLADPAASLITAFLLLEWYISLQTFQAADADNFRIHEFLTKKTDHSVWNVFCQQDGISADLSDAWVFL